MVKGRQLFSCNPWQHQVLVMADTGFTRRVCVGQHSRGVKLVGGGVAWGLAQTFVRQGDHTQMRVAVRCHVLLQPTGEVLVFIGSLGQQGMNRFSR